MGILVSDYQWTKTKHIINKWYGFLQVNEDQSLHNKSLTSDQGFLVYVAITYKALVPYLKGLLLTIDGW